MRIKHVALLLVLSPVVLTLALTRPAGAQLKQALSVFGGLTSTSLSGGGIELDASGVAIGVEFQIPVQEKLSVNPFVFLTSEPGEDAVLVVGSASALVETEVDVLAFGAQVRFWATDQFFVGGQIANFDVELTLSNAGGSVSASESSIGFGAAAGFETGRGLSIGAQLNTADLDGTDYTSLMFLVGWRFAG